jgi:hypothetical protein
MTKIALFLFVNCLLVSFAYCQTEVSWAHGFGISTASDEGLHVIYKDNYIYCGGYYAGQVDFDPGTGVKMLNSINNGWDVFLAKYTSGGGLVWVRNIGGDGEDYLSSIDIDENENIYLTGYFDGIFDLDPGMPYLPAEVLDGFYDSFVLKMDVDGNYQTGFTQNSSSSVIFCGKSGEVVLAGIFQGSTDFDPGINLNTLTSIGEYDIFILTMNDNLEFNSVFQTFGNNALIAVNDLAKDDTDNIYIIGSYSESLNVNINGNSQSLQSMGDYDCFFIKYNAIGQTLMAKSIGGTSSDYGVEVFIDSLTNIYLSGIFGATVDFDISANTNNQTSQGSSAVFLAKYDSSFNLIDVISLGSDLGWNTVDDLQIDNSGHFFLTGSFESTIDFDPGPGEALRTSNGAADIFLAHYDTEFNYVDAVTVGDSEYDYGYSCAVSEEGDVYITGSFSLAADFDPGEEEAILSSTGYEDIFLAKYTTTPVGTFQPAAAHSLSDLTIFPNPTSETLTLNAGIVFQQARVYVYDLLGRLIHSVEDMNGEVLQLNLKGLPDGIYLIEVREENKVWKNTVVISK